MESEEENLENGPLSFSTVHKAKLSIPNITWTRYGSRSGSIPKESNSNPPIQTRNENPSKYNHCLGIFLTILSAFTFSFTALLGKMLNHFHPFNLGVWTFLFMSVIGVITVIFQIMVGNNVFEPVWPLSSRDKWRTVAFLVVRSISGVFALVLFYYTVKFLTVGDALVIDASSPIFVYIMAFLFLQEKFGIVPIFSTILAFTGVALITRPPLLSGQSDYDINSVIGVGFALSAMMCVVCNLIVLKFLENIHHTLINCVYGVLGTIQCLATAWICGSLEVPTDPYDILKIITSGSLFFLGQAFITIALQYEDAGPVGLVRTTELLFIFLWQFIFLGVIPDAYSYVGASLVLLGAILVILRKWVGSLPEDNNFRETFKVLLY